MPDSNARANQQMGAASPAQPEVPHMSADEVRALPVEARTYIHQLATNADPSGMVRENMQLCDTNAGLQIMYRKAMDAAQTVVGCFDAAFAEGLNEAIAETTDERLKDLLERRLIHALYAAQEVTAAPAPQQLGVGNSGFDHKTAADFLNGKTVSDEAMRKFVAASRWAHDDRASLQAALQSERNELAAREAEIALLKTALMNAEVAPQQEAPDNHHQCRLLTRAELDALGAKAEGMDGNQWDMWVQEQFARANRLKIEGSNYD